MTTPILRAAARVLLPAMLAFSVFLLWRGHNEPGGGFAGGLVAAAAFALYKLAHGLEEARRVLRVDPRALIGAGLGIALASGLLPLGRGLPPLTGLWTAVPLAGKAGTPLLFDAGVYVLVAGVALTIVFALGEDPEGRPESATGGEDEEGET
jgi:multicomponent Na+:H+ antiporter subunit B